MWTFFIFMLYFLGTWFNMILSIAKKSRRWRGDLGSLVTVEVVLEEIDSLKMCKHMSKFWRKSEDTNTCIYPPSASIQAGMGFLDHWEPGGKVPSLVRFATNSTLSPPSPYCTHWTALAKSSTVAWGEIAVKKKDKREYKHIYKANNDTWKHSSVKSWPSLQSR